MTPLEEEIVKLSRIWYHFVSVDHHKDRDCHWYIEQYFSYGEEPYYRAYHYGYVGDRFEGTKCITLEEAQEELRDRLALEIHKAKLWVNRNLKEAQENPESWYDPEEYKRMLHYLNGGEWKENYETINS